MGMSFFIKDLIIDAVISLIQSFVSEFMFKF